MSSPIILPLVQTNLDPTRITDTDRFEMALRDKWRQMATAVNRKARSNINMFLWNIPVGLPVEFFRTKVGTNTSLTVISCYVTCVTVGAGGATGLTLRLKGGSASLDFNVLPSNGAVTLADQDVLLNYAVPSGATFIVEANADDHVVSPTQINFSFDCLYL